MEGEHAKGASGDVLPDQSDPTADGRGTAGVEGSVDQLAQDIMDVDAAGQPGETRDGKGVDMDTDMGEGAPDPAPCEPPGSGSVPSTKPKSAFVKIMELGEDAMLMAYLDAFFGKSYRIIYRLPKG